MWNCLGAGRDAAPGGTWPGAGCAEPGAGAGCAKGGGSRSELHPAVMQATTSTASDASIEIVDRFSTAPLPQ